MLYLEDYVELIEHLPSDLRERFTDMREMDLQVQTTVDLLNEKVKKLFHRCALKKSKSSSTDQMYEDIRKEYYKALENADVKVQLANKIYDLVDRHLRKLDQELSKFKMELEADNGGITEILEQRSLELDNPLRSRASDTHHLHKDRKRHIQTTGSSTSQAHAVLLSSAAASSDVASNDSIEAPPEKSLKLSVTVDPTDMLSQLNSDSCSPFSIFSQSPLKNLASDPMTGLVLASTSYSSLSQHADVVFGGSALNGGTSSVSQLFQPATELCDRSQLPLTANPSPTANNTKTNIDSVKQEPGTSSKQQKYEFDRVSVDSLDTSGEPCHSDSSLGPRPSRTKKQTSKAAAWEQQRLQAGARHGNRRKEQADASEEHSTEAGESSSWNYDPNEPRYCICNQVSYGEMVGCDNQKCPIEWFHYGCVGVSEAPKGKWYCPQCTQTMKRRNRNRC